MAADMFIKIDGIKGESGDAKHKDSIDILSWSWGASSSGTTHIGSGGGSGKAQIHDLTLTKYVDSASPALLGKLVQVEHIKSADLTVRKGGGTNPLEYLKIHMEDVIVTAFTTGGSGGQDRITENLTLNFGRYKFDYIPQKADGTGGAALITGFDIAKNQKWG